MTRESARRPRPRFNFSVFAVLQCLIKSDVRASFGWAHGDVPTGMEDFGGFRDWASDGDDHDQRWGADPDAFPCFLRPVPEFKPRSEVDAEVDGVDEEEGAYKYHDDDWEDARAGPVVTHAPVATQGRASMNAHAGGPSRVPNPSRAPPRPDAAARMCSRKSVQSVPPPVSNHGGGASNSPRMGPRGKRGKGGERTYRQGADKFVAMLLRWQVRGLVENDPLAVGVSPLPPPPTKYETKESYYDAQSRIAAEEARATLSRALSKAGLLAGDKRSGGCTGRRAIQIKITHSTLKEAVPGSGLVAADVACRVEAGPRKPLLHEKKNDWRRPGTVVAIRRVLCGGAEGDAELVMVSSGRKSDDDMHGQGVGTYCISQIPPPCLPIQD